VLGLVRFGVQLRPGQAVRVISGPFANAIGQLEKLDEHGRVRVLLEIMGGKVPARLTAAQLELAA
jgi:transcriptional antiterminator RfaH